MLLFSETSSKVGGIAKVLALIGGLFVAMFRTCGGKMDDVARMAGKGDDLYHASQVDDVVRSSRRGASTMDDLYSLSEEAATTRLKDFEVIYMDDLEESSPILKAFKTTEGLSPTMRLQMMQTELLPGNLRYVMSEPGGGKMYELLMGRPLAQGEAKAMGKLFNINIESADEVLDEYVYLDRVVENVPNESIDDLNRRIFEEITQQKTGMRQVNVKTRRSVDNLERMAESMQETHLKGKKVLIERKLDLTLEMKLLKFGIRHAHHIQSFAHLFEKEMAFENIWIYAPLNDSIFKSHYDVNDVEMKSMRSQMKQLSKKYSCHIIHEWEELNTIGSIQQSKTSAPFIGICNLKKADSFTSQWILHHGAILSISGYEFDESQITDQHAQSQSFRPMFTALNKIKLSKEKQWNDFLSELADAYGEEIRKNTSGRIDCLVNIRYASGYHLFDVMYGSEIRAEGAK